MFAPARTVAATESHGITGQTQGLAMPTQLEIHVDRLDPPLASASWTAANGAGPGAVPGALQKSRINAYGVIHSLRPTRSSVLATASRRTIWRSPTVA